MALPLQFGGITSYVVASVFTLGISVILGVRYVRGFLEHKIVFGWLVALLFLAAISAATSAANTMDFATTVRYLAITPISYLILGFALTKRHRDVPLVALMVGAAVNIVMTALAVQTPFVGEIEPGKYVGALSRFYLHPISKELVMPVTIAENCAGAFVMIWFLFSERRIAWWTTYAIFAIAAIGLSLVGATRTYLFSVALVVALMIVHLVLVKRKLKYVGGMVLLFLAIGISVTGSAELRELLEARLDRFAAAGILDNTERESMWLDRWEVARDSDFWHGLSMRQYKENYEWSSHNAFLDWAIIGGWVYGAVVSGGLVVLTLRCVMDIFDRTSDEHHVAQACAVLMMAIVVQVSSPIISSHTAYALLWYYVGMFVAGPRVSYPGFVLGASTKLARGSIISPRVG